MIAGVEATEPVDDAVVDEHAHQLFHVERVAFGALYQQLQQLGRRRVQVLQQRGGLTRENGDAVRREVFSVGNTREPMESYRAFAGRDPEVEALLKRRGLQ